MYNQKIMSISLEGNLKMLEIRRTPSGATEVLLSGNLSAKMRRARMFTLWQFREMFIPEGGLWSHYFTCLKCNWERRNPKIAVCTYCETPMIEIGCPAYFKREEGGMEIMQLRSDLQEMIDKELREQKEKEDKDVIRRDGEVTVFKIELD